ncbi:MAG: hypothetical protein ACYDD1_02305 [Caulobacteraceae bacterium]
MIKEWKLWAAVTLFAFVSGCISGQMQGWFTVQVFKLQNEASVNRARDGKMDRSNQTRVVTDAITSLHADLAGLHVCKGK